MKQVVGMVNIMHADKVLYPATNTTKLDVALYYKTVWEKISPFLLDRPVTFVRSPSGVNNGKFYQRHPSESFPQYIRRVKIIGRNKKENVYITIDELRDLLFLVNLGTIEFHPWGSRLKSIDYPDYIVFDLDPGLNIYFTDIVSCTLQIADILNRYSSDFSKILYKTSGEKGVHVIAYLSRRLTWKVAKDLALEIAGLVVQLNPKMYTISISKAERKGRIFIDYLRNFKASTTVAPYSLRVWSKPSISQPFKLKDIKNIQSADQFTIDSHFI